MSEVAISEVQKRLEATTVTSENLAEFQAEKLGLADKPPREAIETIEPQDDDSQSEPASEDQQTTEEKRRPKIERRFEAVTKARDEAKQEAMREREARVSLEQRLADMERKQAPKGEAEPDPSQFTDMFEYAKALTDYKVDQRLGEERQKAVQARVQAEKEQVLNTWSERVNQAKATMPNFEQVVKSADMTVINEVRDSIFESDVGPQLLYHLADNPEFVEKLQGMTPAAQLRQIGKLEAMFEKQDSKPVVQRSRASAPISPIRSAANGRDVALTADGQFHGSYQAWKAGRLNGQIR
jgi:hypothetical protein